MKALKQLFRHDPANGIYGDRHRTCFAMILDKEPEEIPHFGETGINDDFWNSERKFLDENGLCLLHIVYDGDNATLDGIFQNREYLNPGIPFILGGTSKIGVGHSVVVLNGEIYDPSLSDNGIIGPMSDGYYWVSYIMKRP